MSKKRVAVLISGSGSNLQALIDAAASESYPAEIALVISNKADAFGLQRAQKAGIKTAVISHKDHASRRDYDAKITELLEKDGIEIVCLAGFMRLLSEVFVTRWKDKLLNIHPSLLPSFKGIHAHADAINYGVRFSGCTVHFVRAEMDVGPIIDQAIVPVLQEDTAETLGARVLEQEHAIYPRALGLLAAGKLSVQGEKVIISS